MGCRAAGRSWRPRRPSTTGPCQRDCGLAGGAARGRIVPRDADGAACSVKQGCAVEPTAHARAIALAARPVAPMAGAQLDRAASSMPRRQTNLRCSRGVELRLPDEARG
eukprot:10723284-Alexandrium_andersonii.AAC.1